MDQTPWDLNFELGLDKSVVEFLRLPHPHFMKITGFSATFESYR